MNKDETKKIFKALETLREAQADFSYIFQHAINKEVKKHLSNEQKKDKTLRDFYEDSSNEAAWDLIYRISNPNDSKRDPFRNAFYREEEEAILNEIIKQWAREIKTESIADAEKWHERETERETENA